MPARSSSAVGSNEWLTPRETAELAKLSTQTLANHRWRGTGPRFAKLTPGRGGRIRYRRRDVEQWLAGGTAIAA